MSLIPSLSASTHDHKFSGYNFSNFVTHFESLARQTSLGTLKRIHLDDQDHQACTNRKFERIHELCELFKIAEDTHRFDTYIESLL